MSVTNSGAAEGPAKGLIPNWVMREVTSWEPAAQCFLELLQQAKSIGEIGTIPAPASDAWTIRWDIGPAPLARITAGHNIIALVETLLEALPFDTKLDDGVLVVDFSD